MKNYFSLFITLSIFISTTGAIADELVEETRKLNGTEISYEYISGRSYKVKFEPSHGDYVTLLANFNNHLLYGSAIMGNKEVHFHGARITKP